MAGYWMALSLVAAAMVAGCSGAPSSPPKEIVYAAETAEWSVVTGAKGDPVPDAVPIITMLSGTRYEGFRLAPGTKGHARTLPDGVREVEHERQTTPTMLPIVIEPQFGRGWSIKLSNRRIPTLLIREAETQPVEVMVAVDPPGPDIPTYRRVRGEAVRAD